MKTRPIVGVELKKVKRSDGRRNDQWGGYVPYTDYCLNVSRLKDKIYELETRLMNLKRFGKSRVMKLRQR